MPELSRSSGQGWIVVNTQPHREAFATLNLERQGFHVYCPMVLKRIRHARRAFDARRPLFPSYIFVEYASVKRCWRSIQSTYGVRMAVANGDMPSLLDGAIIEELKVREVDGVLTKPVSRYHVGQHVAVQGGALDGQIGQIIEMRDKDRILVLMEMLNQPVKVHVHADSLSST